MIENLPEPLKKDLTHQYAEDGFALFRMVIPKPASILGLIGQNGTGKSTAMKILAGEMKLNLGKFDAEPTWEEIITFFRGSELQHYFLNLQKEDFQVTYKPQNITALPRVVKGKVIDLLKQVNERDQLDIIIEQLNLRKIQDRNLNVLSGGELQRVAIAAAILRDSDAFLFDEPTSFLDIKERINMARLVRSLGEIGKTVVVIEHDLAILDYLSDYISLFYGKPGAYGIISHPQGVRVGINIYLNGYIKDENMRIRPDPIRFHERPPQESGFEAGSVILSFEDLEKKLGQFTLSVSGGEIHAGEVIGILGPNGIGKTTFVNILSGELAPDAGSVSKPDMKVVVKPQYIEPDETLTVDDFMQDFGELDRVESTYFNRIAKELDLEPLYERLLSELSGGELQKVAIAKCLSAEADLYLLDEPSAFLDVEMRLAVGKLIRKTIENYKKSAFVVEHDIITQDFIADSLLIFDGTPGIHGEASAPMDLHSGMNTFLKNMNITFRRDPQTGRPRVNKEGSNKDTYQKQIGEYYYTKNA